jgi:hypothetical protein
VFTVIVRILLLTDSGALQAPVLVITHFTWLLLVREELVKVGVFVPASIPFTFHWYAGETTPADADAVNVTEAPLHTIADAVDIVTVLVDVLTVNETILPGTPSAMHLYW